ncbi:hypothetical protein R1sor_013927 [Riccia sorocarpa]|uniref:Uncharacterized protein n=1 Tax=Riccia sorocarpa TaxID=122646 RepID=A0ABD3H7Y8_9MARC
MAQQGIQGGAERPEPKFEDQEAPSTKKWESLGAERARNENEANKPLVEKVQDTQNKIKDYFAEKMDEASAKMKTTFVTGNERMHDKSRTMSFCLNPHNGFEVTVKEAPVV